MFPRYSTGFQRWTTAQQARYATTLTGLIEGDKRSTWEFSFVLGTLADMPAGPLAPLLLYANADTPYPLHREKAVGLLGRIDGGRGVASLLGLLDGNMARIAIYALRRAMLSMPTDAALAQLKTVPMQKVTVAKEVLRLAGELGTDDAFQFLRSAAEDDGLHPDVRIALFRALWSYLEKPAVWALFDAGIVNGTPALLRSTIAIPQDGLSVAARVALSQHLAKLLQYSDAQVVRETLQRLVDQPTGEASPALSQALHAILHRAVLKDAELAAEALLLNEAKHRPLALAESAGTIASPLALQAIAKAILRQAQNRRAQIAPAAMAWVEQLLAQERMLSLLPPVALLTLQDTDLLKAFHHLTLAKRSHPGMAHALDAVMHSVSARRDFARLSPLEVALRQHAEPIARRMGLSVLVGLAQCVGWTAELQALLAHYRADASAWIGEAAQLVDPPPLPMDAGLAG